MSLWEFRCIQAGWRKANSSEGGDAKSPTEAEADAAKARVLAKLKAQ